MISRDAFTKFVRRAFAGAAVAAAVSLSATACQAQDAPTPLQKLLLNKHPLLRKIFVEAPPTDVKGLAAQIKAEEITVRQRIQAVRYLATVDCVAYPEAKAMLVKMLHKDKWEPVRYEAAKALKIMLAAGACSEKRDPDRYNSWMQAWRRNNRRTPRGSERSRYDYCPGCCDKKTLNALVKTAYEMNDRASCFEPSLRVREMAVDAIRSCGVPCNAGPYYAEGQPNEMGPPPPEPPGEAPPVKPGEGDIPKPKKPGEGELPDDPNGEAPTLEIDGASRGVRANRVSMRRTIPSASPVKSLNGHCVVALAHGKNIPVDRRYQSIHKGRLYFFSSPSAKEAFDMNPDRYAIAYGGFDPVQYVQSKTLTEGRLLCEYRGQMYCFASRTNWQEFLRDPSLYSAGLPGRSSVRQVSAERTRR